MKDVITQRYTSSTCRLEIVARRSALSRWATTLVLKPLRFQLSLNDSEHDSDASGEGQMLIRGDRTQLEALSQVVQTYVQSRLTSVATFSVPETPESLTRELNIRLVESVEDHPASIAASLGISLQPQGLTTHILTLGPLATDETGSEIRLSTLKLYDLTAVFDQYEAAAISLPYLPPTASWHRRRLTAQLGWSGAAAAIVLVTVGLATTLPRWLSSPQQSTQMASPPPQDSMAADGEEHAISFQPFGDIQLESASSLNPVEEPEEPQPADTPKPLAETPNQAIPKTPEPSFQKAEPSLSNQQPQNQSSLPSPSPAPLPASAAATQPPNSPTAAATSPAPPASLASSAPPASPTPPPPNSSGQTTARRPDAPLPTPPAGAAPPAELAEELANAAALANDQIQPSLASRGSEPARRPLPESTSNGFSIEDRAIGSPPDVPPQVEEVRAYFQQRWHPPENLNQVLAYHLVISPEGTIAEMTPIGPLAATYADLIEPPPSNEPITSSSQTGEALRIRLVFSPNGVVIAFKADMPNSQPTF